MDHAQTSIQAAETHYRAGDYAHAAALLLPLAEQPAPPSAALRVLGLCRLRMGDMREALSLLDRAHTLTPEDPWARLHHGIGLQSVGQHSGAAALFRSCTAALPDDPAPFLNLASSLLTLDDPLGAIRAARKARARAPAMPQTHYTLGLAYLANGLAARAAACFRQATVLAPRFAEAWVNLGVAQYRNGEIENATQSTRAALEADPDNQAAAANLGGFLRLGGDVEASERLLTGIVQRGGDTAAARLNLAADLLAEERAADTLALLSGPPPGAALTRQHWLLQQALALINLNRIDEAKALVASIGTVSAALAPLLQWRLILLCLAEGDVAQARARAASMQTMLEQDPTVESEHRIMGHYDLAKFWSRLGDTDQAFAHWVAGHRLLAKFQPFSRRDHASFVDSTIAHFDAARMRQGPRASNRDANPVFVVGMPRSGTTLLEQILSAHRDVHGAGERMALAQIYWELGGSSQPGASMAQRIAALDGPALDVAATRYLHDLRAVGPGSARIIDKMPANYRHLGLVGLMLPGAKVIACDRDPRDIGLSIFTYRFYGSHGYAHDLADLGWYISQQRRLMAHWHEVLPNPILTVRLRDWVDDFTGTLTRVLEFLELPYDKACERFHEVSRRVRTVSRTQVNQPVNARGLGRWRQYEGHLAPMIEAMGGDWDLAEEPL